MLTYFGPLKHLWIVPAAPLEPDAERTTAAERDAATLRCGDTAWGDTTEPADRSDPGEPDTARRWRFVGAFQPPFC